MEASRLHSDTPSALPAGTRLGEFELLSLLGVGGFGIVYLAFDHALEREVAVKEYMPASLAGRTETMHVSLRSQSDAESFALGLKSFVNEARLLARFDHPSLLKVHRFWEANGTAYMAMPVMRGRTVKEIRLEMVGAPDEAWLRALLDPLLGAIEKLHSEGVYHRDIAPDNIQIEPGGRPVLLDFGAARRVLSDKSQTLTAILKPAYAPIEQYAEAGAVKQGPWTDIYALGATLHFLLLTRPPPPATTRAVHDEASMLTPQVLPGCSASFLNIIDWMLAPRPSDRPQSVAALRDVLEGRVPPPVRREPVPTVSQWDRTVMLSPATQPAPPPASASASEATTISPRRPADPHDDEATVVIPPPAVPRMHAQTAAPMPPPAAAAASATAVPVAALAAGPGTERTVPPPAMTPTPTPPPPTMPAAPAAARSSKLVPIGLAVAALLVAALAAVLWPRQAAEVPLVAQPAASAPVAVAPPPAASVPESQITTVTVPGGSPAPAPATRTTAPPMITEAPATPPVVAQPVDRPATPRVAVTPPVATPAPAPAPAATTAAANRPQPAPQRPQPSANNNPPVSAPPVVVAAPSVVTPPPRNNPPQAEVPPRPQANPAPAVVAETPKPVAAGPEARCGGRNPISHFICMERECLRSGSAGHADCQKWRQNAKRE